MTLDIKNLDIGYPGKTVLKNINLSAKKSDFITLIGKNGAGKSTFLKTIANILPAKIGQIIVNNQNITDLTNLDRSNLVSIVLTDKIDIPLKVYEFIALGRQNYTGFMANLRPKDISFIEKTIDYLNLKHLINRSITEISDGEYQKTLIARALVQDTPILLLDEPTTHLDLENKALLIRQLREVSKNKIVILSTHDLNLILPKTDKIWLTKDGTITEYEKNKLPDNFFNQELLKFDKNCEIFRLV